MATIQTTVAAASSNMPSGKGLVVTRKVGESFTIGENVLVTIEELSNRYVKIRVRAPVDLPIVRTDNSNNRPAVRRN